VAKTVLFFIVFFSIIGRGQTCWLSVVNWRLLPQMLLCL